VRTQQLGVGIRVRRLDKHADYPDALTSEDLAESAAELPVAFRDEETERLLVA
jgi:hypothetical protein